MKLFLSITALFCSFSSIAQKKVEVKDNIILVDGKQYARIEREGRDVDAHHTFNITNIATGKRLIVITTKDVIMAEKITAYNRTGEVDYAEFVFLDGKGHKCESPESFGKNEKWAKYIIKNNLLTDSGGLNEEEIKSFILINGTPMADRGSVKVKF